jgi:hypothetical protein
VILANVEQQSDARAKLANPLQLKAADLKDAPIPLCTERADERGAEVAAKKNFLPARLDHLAD